MEIFVTDETNQNWHTSRGIALPVAIEAPPMVLVSQADDIASNRGTRRQPVLPDGINYLNICCE
jgi:hypothetical protein